MSEDEELDSFPEFSADPKSAVVFPVEREEVPQGSGKLKYSMLSTLSANGTKQLFCENSMLIKNYISRQITYQREGSFLPF